MRMVYYVNDSGVANGIQKNLDPLQTISTCPKQTIHRQQEITRCKKGQRTCRLYLSTYLAMGDVRIR